MYTPRLVPVSFLFLFVAGLLSGCNGTGEDAQVLGPLREGSSVRYTFQFFDTTSTREYTVGGLRDSLDDPHLACRGIDTIQSTRGEHEERDQRYYCLDPWFRPIRDNTEPHIHSNVLYRNIEYGAVDLDAFVVFSAPFFAATDYLGANITFEDGAGFSAIRGFRVVDSGVRGMTAVYEGRSTHIRGEVVSHDDIHAVFEFRWGEVFPAKITARMFTWHEYQRTGEVARFNEMNATFVKQDEKVGKGARIEIEDLAAISAPIHPFAEPVGPIPREGARPILAFPFWELDSLAQATVPAYKEYRQAHPDAAPFMANYREYESSDRLRVELRHKLVLIAGSEGFYIECSKVVTNDPAVGPLMTDFWCDRVTAFTNNKEFHKEDLPAMAIDVDSAIMLWRVRLDSELRPRGFHWSLTGPDMFPPPSNSPSAYVLSGHATICIDDILGTFEPDSPHVAVLPPEGASRKTNLAFSCLDATSGVFSGLRIPLDPQGSARP